MIKVGQLALGLALQTSYFGCLWSKIVNELLIGKKMGYSVSHIITYPSKELCSIMALGEVGVSLP